MTAPTLNERLDEIADRRAGFCEHHECCGGDAMHVQQGIKANCPDCRKSRDTFRAALDEAVEACAVECDECASSAVTIGRSEGAISCAINLRAAVRR